MIVSSHFQVIHFEKPKSVTMRSRNFNSVGALHPILFFAVMYVVVLLLSIFICSSLFYSLNDNSSASIDKKIPEPVAQKNFPVPVSTAVVIR